MEIVAQCIAEAHERTVDAIIDEGALTSIEVEPGKFMSTWELTDPVMIIVRHPDTGQLASEACEFGAGFIEQYKKDMLTVQKRGFVYEYPQRLFDYPMVDSSGRVLYGNGDHEGIDQIREIIETITNHKTSRRALAITWVPGIDAGATEPPCLQFTHFVMRPGVVAHGQDPKSWYLSGRFPFRSHDMLSGYPANAIGLLGLMDYVASGISKSLQREIGEVRIGSLVTWSSSAHIYCDAQSELLKRFTGLIAKKKMSKTWWATC